MTGGTRSNPPGGMFDKNTFRCVGVYTSLDGKTTASTVCAAIDVDGDKRLAYFIGIDGKVAREYTTGTGKYEGIVATTDTVQPLGPFPVAKAGGPYPVVKAGTFQDCNHQTGTYKLK